MEFTTLTMIFRMIKVTRSKEGKSVGQGDWAICMGMVLDYFPHLVVCI